MFRLGRSALICVLGLTNVIGVSVSAAVPATEDRRAVLARQKEHYLQSIMALPLLDKRSMSDLLQLRVEGGQLEFHTPLEPWPDFEARRVQLDGSTSPASVIYAQFVKANPAARQFEFKVEEYPAPEVYGQLHFQWHPSAVGQGADLSIEHTEQTGTSFVRAFYMQNPGMARLLVFANDASTEHNMQSFNYMSRNFVSLREAHPTEVEEWLRPMLHRLQQDAVFAPDASTAWQVFSDSWPVSAKAQEQVRTLLPELNSEQSRVRNHAVDQMGALGQDGATAVLRLDRRGLSLEQNIKLDQVIARFRKIRTSEARRLLDDPEFLLDCQYCDNATARRLAAERLTQILGSAVTVDPDAPPGARAEAVEKIRNHLHPPSATTRPGI